MTLEELRKMRDCSVLLGERVPDELAPVFDLAEAMLMLEEMGTNGVEGCWAQCSVSRGLSSLFAWGNGLSDDMLFKKGESPSAAISAAYEEWRKCPDCGGDPQTGHQRLCERELAKLEDE